MAVALQTSPVPAPPASSTRLRTVEVMLLGYLGVVSVVAVLRAGAQAWWLLLTHGLIVLLLYLLTRQPLGITGRTIRELYPLLLLPVLYGELDILNAGTTRVYDDVVQRWELLVFKAQVSREWWQASASRFWSTVLHGAYLSYYLIVSVPAFYFVWRADLEAVRRFVLVVMTTFFICYLVFLFFPVAGPYYQFPRPESWFTDNLMARLTYQALATGSSYGAAFPSSHVAAALAATITAGRVSRPLGIWLLIPTILLTIGVVYCQMHYAVDALAGLAVGGLVAGGLSRGLSACPSSPMQDGGDSSTCNRR